MNRLVVIALAFVAVPYVVAQAQESGRTSDFVCGADVSWLTEMEHKGEWLYTTNGVKRDGFLLMKDYGLAAVRLRVWVDPLRSPAKARWCDAADTVEKAVRAQKAGLDVMIDFHYSDWWADPCRQDIPLSWRGHDLRTMCGDVSTHTEAVLTLLKKAGVEPRWVQVGNETQNGMLWTAVRGPSDALKWVELPNKLWAPEMIEAAGNVNRNPEGYAKLFSSGYDAVRRVFPKAKVLVHLVFSPSAVRDGWIARNLETLSEHGARWDMIGISVYPHYSREEQPDYDRYVTDAITEVRQLSRRWKCDTMIVETGFRCVPKEYEQGRRLLRRLIYDAHKATDGRCRGVFYWEPQCRPKNYALGAFDETGKPTPIMKGFLP